MKKVQNNNNNKDDIYMKKWHDFSMKQSIEKVCFEYSCDKNIFLENPVLDLNYVKTTLKEYNVIYSDKDYSIILKEVKKNLKDNKKNI